VWGPFLGYPLRSNSTPGVPLRQCKSPIPLGVGSFESPQIFPPHTGVDFPLKK
jgi:hypothetical protein